MGPGLILGHTDGSGGGAAGASTRTTLLEARGISKAFSGVPALRGVDLTIEVGEVHGLLGANGCGKSTLIKILAGFHQPDGGTLLVRGTKTDLPLGPRGLRDWGVSFVHQDLGLVPEASVLEHMALDSQVASGSLAWINWKAEERRVSDLLERFEVAVSPKASIDSLRPLERAMVAIVRAVGDEQAKENREHVPQLLVLDEPTVFLPRHEVNQLFALLKRLTSQGNSVLLVSHDLDEVLEATDRFTVLRDGRLIGTRATAESTRDDIVFMILGSRNEGSERTFVESDETRQSRVSLRDVSGERIRDLNLELRAGEVLGVTGLAGSGFEELPELIFGARPLRSGELEVNGGVVKSANPAQMMQRGIVLIPADRKSEGAAQELTITENLGLPYLREQKSGWWIGWPKLGKWAYGVCQRLGVVPNDVRLNFGNLSGGNQQKALIGKWLEGSPDVMLLNEPTQGVDIGARREIFRLIRLAVDQGMAVLCCTSDYEQLIEMADRVVVLSNGSFQYEVVGASITKSTLSSAVYSGDAYESDR